MEAWFLTQSTGKSTQTCITGSHESQEKVGYDCNNTGKEADKYRGSKVRKLNHLLFIPSKQGRSTSLDIYINFIQQFSDAGWRTFGEGGKKFNLWIALRKRTMCQKCQGLHLIFSTELGFNCIYHTLLGPQTLEESFQRFKEILTEDFNNEQDPQSNPQRIAQLASLSLWK